MRFLIIFFCCAITATAAAESTPTAIFPKDLRWVAKVNMAHLKAGEVGEWMSSISQKEQVARGLNALRLFTGIDLMEDVDTLMAGGMVGGDDKGVFAAFGRFDPQRIDDLTSTLKGMTKEIHGGQTLIHWLDEKNGDQPTWGSIIGDHTLLVSKEKPLIERVLDTVDGKIPSITETVLAETLREDAIVTLAATDLGNLSLEEGQGRVLQHLTHMALSIGQTGPTLTLHAEGQGKDETSANQVQQVVNGLMALAQMNRDKIQRPELLALLVLFACTKAPRPPESNVPNHKREWHQKDWINLPKTLTLSGAIRESFTLPDQTRVGLFTYTEDKVQELYFFDLKDGPYIRYYYEERSFFFADGFPTLNLNIWPSDREVIYSPKIYLILENVLGTFSVALKERSDGSLGFIHILSDPGYQEEGYTGVPLGSSGMKPDPSLQPTE